jgi:hypothetical protein
MYGRRDMSNADEESGETFEAEIDVEALLAHSEERNENPHDQAPGLDVPPEDEEPPPPEEPPLPDDAPAAGGPAAGHAGQPIAATCRRRFTAVHNSGRRPVSAITHIVIHSTEGDTAAGAATWFANPESAGSAHLVVDDRECYRTLDDTRIPFGAPGTNTNGFHIEHAGHAKLWNRQKWMSHEQTLRRGAFKAAFHAVKFGVPLKILSANDLRHGRSGFVTHATVSEAFHGSHTDPGPGFPLDHYMELVRRFAREITS